MKDSKQQITESSFNPEYYLEMNVRVPVSLSELLSFFLFEQGAQGVETREGENDGKIISLRVFWPDEREGALKGIWEDSKNYLGIPDNVSMEYSRKKILNWQESWKINFQEISVGKHFLIIPLWEKEKKRSTERREIILYPGKVFGTGYHETTFLALLALDEILPHEHPKSIIDVGCGSGILLIAGLHFSPCEAIGVDIDPLAEEEMKENVRHSGFDPNKINFFCGSANILNHEIADLVVANITADVLLELRADFKKILKPGGSLVLSGIYEPYFEQILSEFQKNFTVLKRWEKNNWHALWLKI